MSLNVSSLILTHLANIANGKKSCSVLQQFTGRKWVTLHVFGAVLGCHPSRQPCRLDVRLQHRFCAL